MAIKLGILNNGEYVISNVSQATNQAPDGTKVVVCYVLNNPRSVEVTDISFEPDGNNMNSKVKLFSWPRFTDDTAIELPLQSLVTFTNPSKDLLSLYESSLK
jgi:hypothetical protein